MNPGDLNRRVHIKRVTEYQDDNGSFHEQWDTFAIRWASVRPSRGREAYINDQDLAEIDFVVSMRYDKTTAQITEKDVVYYGQKKLEITGLLDVEDDHKEIRLFCTQVRDGN